MKTVPEISELTYRCKYCNFLCTKKTIPELTRTKTKQGNYGTNCTPTPTVYYDEQYKLLATATMSNLVKLLDEDCLEISGWNDDDLSPAVSEQVTFGEKSCFKFDTKTEDYASRNKNIGSIEGLGNRIVIFLSLYCDNVGTKSAGDSFRLLISRTDWFFAVVFASDGLYIRGSGAYNEVGTNLVSQDVWQEWTFDIDLSDGVANAKCDVSLNKVFQASDVDCSYLTGSGIDGYCIIEQQGYTTDDQISYVDYIKIGGKFSTDNLITNGEMELDSNWNDYGSPSVNERSSEQIYSGNYSRKFTGLFNAGIKSDTFTTVTDQKYFGEFWIYPVDCTEVTILVRRGDDGGNSYGAQNISGLVSNTWNKYEFIYTETGGGSGAYVALYKENTYYIDDVSIGSGSKVVMGLRFVAETSDTPAKIIDSANKFADKQFRSEQPIKIETGSGTNDGTYTIAVRGVSRGTLTLSDDDSLTTENIATAGEVTISDVTYEPKVTTGCPFCGSLNNK